VVTTASVMDEQCATDERSRVERVRAAALELFATRGTVATSLRMVAGTAGVSVGLVQHHFATKAGLVKAVNDHAMAVVGAALAAPLADSADPVAELGQRVTALITEHTDVVDYLARALVDDTPTGAAMFAGLVTIVTAQWDQLREQRRTRPDLDPTWAALNPLVLVLGAVLLREHVGRHLGEPFTTPTQLRRWEHAVNALLREGQLRGP
jgi:AcrR family transcriptional regulator